MKFNLSNIESIIEEAVENWYHNEILGLRPVPAAIARNPKSDPHPKGDKLRAA